MRLESKRDQELSSNKDGCALSEEKLVSNSFLHLGKIIQLYGSHSFRAAVEAVKPNKQTDRQNHPRHGTARQTTGSILGNEVKRSGVLDSIHNAPNIHFCRTYTIFRFRLFWVVLLMVSYPFLFFLFLLVTYRTWQVQVWFFHRSAA